MEIAKLKDVLKEPEILKIQHLQNVGLEFELNSLTVRNLFDISLYVIGNETNGLIPVETNLISMTWSILTKRAISKNLSIFY